jgi:hypothetical protein
MICRSAYKLTFLLAIVVCLMTEPAAAYIGPGAGLSGIGALLAVFAAVGVAVFGFIWYPIKRLLRKGRKETEDRSSETA